MPTLRVVAREPALLRRRVVLMQLVRLLMLLLLLRLLERLQAQLGLVLASYVPTDCVVTGECSRAERTRHSDSLMPLPDVGSQVGFVAVESFAEGAL